MKAFLLLANVVLSHGLTVSIRPLGILRRLNRHSLLSSMPNYGSSFEDEIDEPSNIFPQAANIDTLGKFDGTEALDDNNMGGDDSDDLGERGSIEQGFNMESILEKLRDSGDAPKAPRPLSGVAEGYTWRDDENMMYARVAVPADTPARDVKVEITKRAVRVGLAGAAEPVVMGTLSGPVRPDDSYWTMEAGGSANPNQKFVCLDLAKVCPRGSPL